MEKNERETGPPFTVPTQRYRRTSESSSCTRVRFCQVRACADLLRLASWVAKRHRWLGRTCNLSVRIHRLPGIGIAVRFNLPMLAKVPRPTTCIGLERRPPTPHPVERVQKVGRPQPAEFAAYRVWCTACSTWSDKWPLGNKHKKYRLPGTVVIYNNSRCPFGIWAMLYPGGDASFKGTQPHLIMLEGRSYDVS